MSEDDSINISSELILKEYGSRWFDSTEIDYRVSSSNYWKRKLAKEVEKCLSMRDRRSLSELVKSCALLRNTSAESFYTSVSMMKLVQGLAVCFPEDNDLKKFILHFNSKLKDIKKTKECRDIISNVYEQKFDKKQVTKRRTYLLKQIDDNKLKINCTSNFNILLTTEEHNDNIKMALLLKDYKIECDIISLSEKLDDLEWECLVNRVDYYKYDIDSWKALINMLNRVSENTRQSIREFVKSYWKSFHLYNTNNEELNNLIKNALILLDII